MGKIEVIIRIAILISLIILLLSIRYIDNNDCDKCSFGKEKLDIDDFMKLYFARCIDGPSFNSNGLSLDLGDLNLSYNKDLTNQSEGGLSE